MNTQEIADQNVERLLGAAYRPEPIDPAFVREVEEKLLHLAHAERTVEAVLPGEAVRLTGLRRRLGWCMAAAAALSAVLVGWYAFHRPWPDRSNQPDRGNQVVEINRPQPPPSKPDHGAIVAAVSRSAAGLTAKPRPEAPVIAKLTLGETLSTKPGEPRRLSLADGSQLYVNGGASLAYVADRKLRLDRGEIYLEVAPKTEAERFVVQTSAREVTAVGTHFHVAAEAAGAGVLVTQGKVRVSDVSGDVQAGQQVKPDQKQATTAPRATHVLDWLRPLVAAGDAALVPTCQHEGGALIAIDPNGQELQLSMRKYHIDVHIEDGFARTTIDQTYFNNTWNRLEGTFYFPLPPDASMSRLAMYVIEGKDCKLMEGGMAERDHARNTFETIRHERRDPALLEWVDGSTFKMRVFPLEAWQDKRIILSYTQRLPSLYGVAKYRFPGGHNMQVVRDWSFAAHVAGAKNWDVLTPSHPEMKRTPGDALDLHTQARLIKPEQDVVLELREREAPPHGASFATHLQDGERYFMARFRPRLDMKPERQRRDWIVLFETSANRDPLLARTQIEVLRNVLKNVEYDDTVALLTCNTRVQVFDAKPRPATPANVQEALAFLEKAHLIGGCDLEQGLGKSLEFAKSAKNPHIVHLGAGVPSLGEIKDDVLAKLIPENVPYVGVGVGKKWNRAFMKMAADRTGGYFAQINPDEGVAWRAFDLVATLNTPRLLDVQVIDPAEKISYLTDAVTLAQGEEICAFARAPADKFPVPAKVIITGRLDGKPFSREVEVRDVAPSAGFLPRTWAKLEIDRLLADGQDKNKAAITALSKSMYVMSPFTSLLVLETEADYQRFNIDRGRKDHWAMYATPERIPQVYEPDPLYRDWWTRVDQPKDGEKRTVEQVLDTILLRLPPQYIVPAGRHVYLPIVATARQVVLADQVVAFEDELLERETLSDRRSLRLGELTDEMSSAWRFLGRTAGGRAGGLTRGLELDSRSRARGLKSSRDLSLSLRGDLAEKSIMPRFLRERLDAAGGIEEAAETALSRRSRLYASGSTLFFRQLERREMDDFGTLSRPEGATQFSFLSRSEAEFLRGSSAGRPMSANQPLSRLGLIDEERPLGALAGSGPMGAPGMFLDRKKARFAMDSSLGFGLVMDSIDGAAWTPPLRGVVEDLWMQSLARHMAVRQSVNWMTYQRPQQQLDQRLFNDLTIHAPGLNATLADLRHTLDEEAIPEKPAKTGAVDPAARALFEKARQAGWYSISFPGVGRIPDVTIVMNGQGQFSYRRVLSSGLTEQVVCDGTSMWHLYPEIGVGTRRPFSKHHAAELAQWSPWALPRPEDLAVGADVRLVNANTVALAPLQAPEKQAKGAVSRHVHIVFGDDGKLAETRLIESPSGKVLARRAIDAKGRITIFDADGKQVEEHVLTTAPAPAPDLKPKLQELVVIDMPLRTGAYLDSRLQAMGKDVNESARQALRLRQFTFACFSRDRDALPIFGAHFHAKGDKRLGFYTLLSARDTHFHQQPNPSAPGIATFDVVQEHPKSALAQYLAHNQKNLNVVNVSDAVLLESLPGPEDSFIARLTAFRNAFSAWRHPQIVANNREAYEREKTKLIAFLRVNTSPLFAFVLTSNLNYLNSNDRGEVAQVNYAAQKDQVSPLGLGYVFGYDAGQHLFYKGDAKEAVRILRELYLDTVKLGVLPKIDQLFDNVLNDGRGDGPGFEVYLRGVVSDLLKKDEPHAALLVALQATQVGSTALGDELYQHIVQQLPEKADRLVLLAALEYLSYQRLDARAETLRDRLVAQEDLAGKASTWRLSAAIARERGQSLRALADLEKALDLEYRQMGDLINLEAVRNDYRDLLGRYLEIAKAAQTLQQAPPEDLAGRVVRAADRWRSLDTEARHVCQTAAKVLKLLGAKDLAWDYQTTPVALRPNEAAPWTDLATELRGDGELALADHAYARAFLSESTNPQILWDRAQNLLQMGRVGEARALWQQIVNGTWQQRFQEIVPRARWHLEHN